MQEPLEPIDEGIASAIFRARLKARGDGGGADEQAEAQDGDGGGIGVKRAPARRRYAPEPHDSLKEALVLASLRHPNVRAPALPCPACSYCGADAC